MSDRFPRIPTQESLDRLEALDRQRERRERFKSVRRIGWITFFVGQIVIIALIAAQHTGWPI